MNETCINGCIIRKYLPVHRWNVCRWFMLMLDLAEALFPPSVQQPLHADSLYEQRYSHTAL